MEEDIIDLVDIVEESLPKEMVSEPFNDPNADPETQA